MAATKSRLTWRQASSVIVRRQYGEQDMSARVEPALDEQVPADGPDLLGLAVHERVHPPAREVQVR